MSEIKITELKKAAKELNEEFGFEIDVKLKREELCEVISEIWDATKLDKKDENYIGIDEIEDLSETTQAVLNALKPESEDEEEESDYEQEEEETEDEPETDEEDEDEDEEVKEKPKKKSAKELAKEAKEKTKKSEAERKARVAEKKAEKAKEKKETKKAPVKEKVAKKEKSISAITFIQTEVCKNFKISNEDIIKKLEKAGFTTTSHRYVDMRRKEALAVISILKDLGKVE